MHEMSLCQSILEIIENQACTLGFHKVIAVRLEIGKFASVELAALRFGFSAASKGSMAEGARLDIIETPGQAWCLDCRKSVVLQQRLAPCPVCGGDLLRVSGGMELQVKELEVV